MSLSKRIAVVAAAAAALAACSRGSHPSTVHLVAPAVADAGVPPPAPPPAASGPAPSAAPAPEDAPSPAEVAEFQKPVPK